MTSADTRAACLDPETLAAWMDGGLSGRDLASAEAHAATCARCQAILAALAKSAPIPVQPERSWRRFLVPALVPLTALTVMAIWLAVPRNRSEGTPSAAQSAAHLDMDRERVGAPAPRDEAKVEVERRAATASDVARQGYDAGASARPSAGPAANMALRAPAAAPFPPPAPTEPAASPAPTAPPAEESTATARKEVASAVEQAQTPARLGGAAALDMIVPEPPKGWRLNSDRVERSTDGGSTWTVQYEEADAGLVALSSPSPEVCWVVGRAGTVLVTSDGRTWRRVSFPKTSDLASVLASDEQNAVVSTAEGTVYVTKNGGQTWELPRR